MIEIERRVGKIEKRIDEMDAKVFRNGISQKINIMWDERKRVKQILYGVLLAVLISWATQFIARSESNQEIKQAVLQLTQEIQQLKNSP